MDVTPINKTNHDDNHTFGTIMPPRDEIRYFGNHIYEASTAYDADWWENVRQFADVHHYDIDDLIGKWAEW